MSERVTLSVGPIAIELGDRPELELLAVFRDRMYQLRRAVASSDDSSREGEESETLVRPREEFRAPGETISARLDLMGRDAASTLARLDRRFQELLQGSRSHMTDPAAQERIDAEYEVLRSLNGQSWVDQLPSAPRDAPGTPNASIGSVSWLLRQIYGMDLLTQVRAILLAYPDSEVALDITTAWPMWWETAPGPDSLPSRAVEEISRDSAIYVPVIVLTEGRNDAEFLKNALEVLYPHLTDLIRVLDYELRPEGGAGPVVNLVKAFAAAGIVNRIVAVFDNDTAAADALRNFDQSSLPAHIRILQYPDIALANEYPALGPPTVSSPVGAVTRANVNKLAGSIELYLGEDVLRQEDGNLYPVQWRSYSAGLRRYQGEVVKKREIHDRFRNKYDIARRYPDRIAGQDWSGLRLILDSIREAAQSLPAWIENGIRESGDLSWAINWAAAAITTYEPWPEGPIRRIESGE
jgi:hypothetical protein